MAAVTASIWPANETLDAVVHEDLYEPADRSAKSAALHSSRGLAGQRRHEHHCGEYSNARCPWRHLQAGPGIKVRVTMG